MNFFTDFNADDFTVFSSSDDVNEWSRASDEAGNRVFDAAVVIDQLQVDRC